MKKIFLPLLCRLLIVILMSSLMAGNVKEVSAAPVLLDPPSNDEFVGAILISSTPYQSTIPDAATLATPQSGDPSSGDPIIICINQTGLSTLWYKFMAPTEGILEVSTLGSEYDTVAVVWQGTQLNSLSLTSCNDNAYGTTLQSTTRAHVLAGSTYFIEITNVGGTSGLSAQDSGEVTALVTGDDLTVDVNFTATTGGVFDDSHSSWTYSGTWQTYNGSGPYNATLHESNVAGNYAEIPFNGTQVALIYLKAPGRGLIQVYIDDVLIDTINANGTLTWQVVWTSQTLPAGDHIVRFVNGGGGWIDLDALQIAGTPPPVDPGKYDDFHTAWIYYTATGSWQTYNGNGPYNNTLHEISNAGSYAEVIINGGKVTLTYLKASGRGLIQVYIDGELVDTINANGALTWQATWTSSIMDPGVHTIRLVNGGGGWIDLDAIEVYPPPTPVGANTYDDYHSAWTYSGTWVTYNGPGPYNNTLHEVSTAGAYAEVYFTGIRISLTYLRAPSRGLIEVYVDGELVDTINANGALAWQQKWTSPTFAQGAHTVRFQNGGGGWIDLDAVQIYAPPVPVVPGAYDDFNTAWTYSGSWITYNGLGPYNNTLHEVSTAGEYAEVLFNGDKVTLAYLKAPGRGSIQVYIDNILVDTINANGPLTWQVTWTGPTLVAGVHTVRFVNGGGGWIDLDAIQVDGPPVPVTPGNYDDSHAAWAYFGAWGTYNGPGPYNNTLHQTNTAFDYADVAFNGSQVTLAYLKAPGRGSINIYIDGILVDTVNASNASIIWQATWTSSILASGEHTVRFENASGGWIDLDAIAILP